MCAWRDADESSTAAKAAQKPRFSSQLERDLLEVIKHGQGRPDAPSQR
jgi:hypothetical protein